MSKNIQTALRFVAGISLVGFLATSTITRAQRTVSGDWKATVKNEENKINLNLERSERGHHNQMGQTYDFSELQGLTREQATNGGPVRFSLVREAGRIDCEGTFQNGRGSGTFQFSPNQTFVAAMKSRGFDFEKNSSLSDDEGDRSEDRLFAATTLDVTTGLADDLTSSGF